MRTNIILAVIAAMLAVPTTLSYMADATIFTRPDEFQYMFEGLTADKVNVISLRLPKQEQPQPVPGLGAMPAGPTETQFDELHFVKQGGHWVIYGGALNGAPVKESMIDARIFQHLVRVRTDPEVVIVEDADPEILASSLLTPETAFGISCKLQSPATVVGGRPTVETLAELLVGKDNRAGNFVAAAVRGFHVRKSDSRDVILYETPSWERSVEPNQWVDKVVHNLNESLITRFSLKNSKTEDPMVFERKPGSDATWIAVEKPDDVGAVRQGEVTTMISRYRQIQANTLIGVASAQNLASLGLLPPVMEITATLEDGSVHGIKVGNKHGDKNEYYVLSTGLNFVRTIPEWVVTNFQKGPKDLFDPKG